MIVASFFVVLVWGGIQMWGNQNHDLDKQGNWLKKKEYNKFQNYKALR